MKQDGRGQTEEGSRQSEVSSRKLVVGSRQTAVPTTYYLLPTTYYVLPAILMILLILSLPPLFAQSISVTSASGSAHIPNFARRGDTLEIVVIADIPGSTSATTAASRVRLYTREGQWVSFDSCTPQSGGFYSCKLRNTEVLRNVLRAAPFEVRIMDVSGTNTLVREPVAITIDSQPPVLLHYNITPSASRSGQTAFSYKAEDYSFEAGDSSACSGILEIRFIVDGRVIAREPGQSGACSLSRDIPHTFSQEGVYRVCAQAVDFFNQTSSIHCQTYTYDNQPPAITELLIKSLQGFTFTHIPSGTSTQANIAVRIRGDVDISTVQADLSALNPALGTRTPTRKSQDLYIFENVEITNPQECRVSVQATDTLGNHAEQVLTCTLPTDARGPQVSEIYTGYGTNGSILLSEYGSIFVDLEDLDDTGSSGIGFQQANVFINAGSLGLASSVKAQNCTSFGNVWTCEFPVAPKVASGTYTIRVDSATADDLGNKITTPQEATITIDKDGPHIKGMESVTVRHNGVTTQDVAVQGDSVTFVVRVKDYSTASADFSALGGATVFPDCTQTSSGDQLCSFSDQVTVTGPTLATTVFSFKDDAGNEEVLTHQVRVLGLAGSTTPNFWKVREVTCSPSVIDRQVTTLRKMPVYCQAPLELIGSLGTNELPGVIIKQISRGSRAEQAGLQVGDVMMRYNSKSLTTVGEFLQEVVKTNPSQTIAITYERNGTSTQATVVGGNIGINVRENLAVSSTPQIVGADLNGAFKTACTGDLEGYVSDVKVINNGLGTTAPILAITLSTNSFNTQNITFTCNLQLFTEAGGRFTQSPEIEPVTATIGFYNNPLGELAKVKQERINSAVREADNFLSWMDNLAKIMEYAEVFCNVWNALVNTVVALTTVLAALDVLDNALSWNPALAAGVDGTESVVCLSSEKLRQAVTGSPFSKQFAEMANRFCGWMSCQTGLLDVFDEGGSKVSADDLAKQKSTKARAWTSETIGDWLTLNLGESRPLGGFSQALSNRIQSGINSGSVANPNPQSGGEQSIPLQNPAIYLNVKDNLIYSTVVPPLCLPGIVHNLNKLRQIECRYALCMSKDVRNGLPESICSDTKHYQTCRFVTGEIFALVPFAPIVNYYLSLLQRLLSDPLVLAGVLAGALLDCQNACNVPKEKWATYYGCAGLQILNVVGRAISTIDSIAQSKNLGIGQSTASCDELDEWQNQLSRNKQQGKPSATAYGR